MKLSNYMIISLFFFLAWQQYASGISLVYSHHTIDTFRRSANHAYLKAVRYSTSPIGGSTPPVQAMLTLKPTPAPDPTCGDEEESHGESILLGCVWDVEQRHTVDIVSSESHAVRVGEMMTPKSKRRKNSKNIL